MEGFQFIDIIILAMAAGFIVLRLRSVLGRRTGHEPPQTPQAGDAYGRPDNRGGNRGADNVVQMPPVARIHA